MKVVLKPVVTGKKPEPMRREYKEAIRAHAQANRYDPEKDPVLKDLKEKMRDLNRTSYRVRAYN